MFLFRRGREGGREEIGGKYIYEVLVRYYLQIERSFLKDLVFPSSLSSSLPPFLTSSVAVAQR